MTTRVAINGFGRIGRNVLKCIIDDDECADLEIVSINDLTDARTLAHLYKYDSVQGVNNHEIDATENELIIDGKTIKILSERDPEKLPWKSLDIDIVIESTGFFTKRKDAEKHIKAGARKVVISAPATDPDVTIVLGVNDDNYKSKEHHIVSNASCTTNCLAPMAKVLNDELGIVRGLMTTIHSYTNDQKILDLPHKDLRRGRAANLSMIPTTTGAARAVSLVLPELEGKLDGMAIRVPTPNVSIIDLVAEVEQDTTAEVVNDIYRKAASGSLKGILRVEEKPLVSIDFKGDEDSSIIDGLSTKTIGKRMVKVLSWYDNEWGYSNRTKDLVKFIIKSNS
jgi:glyceraldehyde 3-phosphate dehydrogenase